MTDLNIDKAVEAARVAIANNYYTDADLATVALSAALPHIRAALADEIEAKVTRLRMGTPVTNYDIGLADAARVVRGEDA